MKYKVYVNSRNELKIPRTNAQNLYWNELYTTLKMYWNSGNMIKFYAILKQRMGIRTTDFKSGKVVFKDEFFDEYGKVLTEAVEILERWRRNYNNLSNNAIPIECIKLLIQKVNIRRMSNNLFSYLHLCLIKYLIQESYPVC